MARKVFISFLGFSNYKECTYYKDDFCSSNVRFIQEATLDYLQTFGEWTVNDVAYILLTEGAKTKNWVDNGHRNPETNEIIEQIGLETSLKQKNYSFQIKTIEHLPDGKNEEEQFELFRRIYEVIQAGDSLYFDVTHGFRSLPMLALVLINYTKFLKDIEVKSITYGNFEVREKLHNDDGNVHFKAPIIDLLPLSGIQDWTFAAADYLKNGNADKFTELSRAYKTSLFKGLKSGSKEDAIDIDSLTNELKAVTDDFQTCRGKNILSSKNISALKKKLKQFDRTVIEPLNPVVKKLEDAFSEFEETTQDIANCKNGLEAAKWCISNHLFQQAATILQECVVTFFCVRYGLDISSDVERKLVNGAFAKCEKLNSSKTKAEEKEAILKEVEGCSVTQRLINDEQISDRAIYEAFSMLTTERNDINHSGMRKEPHSADKIRNNINKAFTVFSSKLFMMEKEVVYDGENIMKKVHITLVGGQPVPVYIGIKDDGLASTVVLVCSSQSRTEAERIKEQFPKRKIIVKDCPPVELDDIETLATELSKEYADYEKTINLTSGTKLWSLTFFRIFNQDKNSHFIYIDQNNLITDILTKYSHVGSINTLTRFELYGTPLTSFRMLEEYDDEDLLVANEIERFRNKNRYEFLQLTGNRKALDLGDRGILTTEKGSRLEYSLDERWARIELYTNWGRLTKEFHCRHLFDILFNSGWFELKTAKELSKNERINKIWLNCEFADSEGNPKNEIDIIAELDNRLLFVECKTMIHDSTDIDKFRSAFRNFSGTSSTGIFVTNDRPNAVSMSRYEHAMEKCKDNGILTFNFSLWSTNLEDTPTLKAIVNEQIQIQNKR